MNEMFAIEPLCKIRNSNNLIKLLENRHWTLSQVGLGRGVNLVVSVLTFFSDDPSSNPTDVKII